MPSSIPGHIHHASLHAHFLLNRLAGLQNDLKFSRLSSEGDNWLHETAVVLSALAKYFALAERPPTSPVNFMFHVAECLPESRLFQLYHLTNIVDAEIQEAGFTSLYLIARSTVPADLPVDADTLGEAVLHALMEKPLEIADGLADPRWSDVASVLERSAQFRASAAKIDAEPLARRLSKLLPHDLQKWDSALDAEIQTYIKNESVQKMNATGLSVARAEGTFILQAPLNLPEDLTLLYEDTARAVSIAHAKHLAMADPTSTFPLESLPPNVNRLSEAVQQSKTGLRRLESELNPVSGCRTHSNFHVATITEADRMLAAAGRILLARAGIESHSPTDPAEVRRYFQGVPSFDLYSLVGAMRQEICDAAIARKRAPAWSNGGANQKQTTGRDSLRVRKLLTGWREIAATLDMKYDDRDKIKSLNDRFQGPIRCRGKGTRPMVNEDDLLEWWNSLALQQQELANRQQGIRLSAEEQFDYSRDGRVAPELRGSVKKRRKDKQV